MSGRNLLSNEEVYNNAPKISGLWKYNDILIQLYFEIKFDSNDKSIGSSSLSITNKVNGDFRYRYEGVVYRCVNSYLNMSLFKWVNLIPIMPKYNYTINVEETFGAFSGHMTVSINNVIEQSLRNLSDYFQSGVPHI
jgi:hypothetical protein